MKQVKDIFRYAFMHYLLRIPPSTEALRHSGWDSRLLTSSTDTLYFCVALSKDSLPVAWKGVMEHTYEEESLEKHWLHVPNIQYVQKGH